MDTRSPQSDCPTRVREREAGLPARWIELLCAIVIGVMGVIVLVKAYAALT